ncbi:sigma-54-dependent transcriptional regulator [Plesiocystis pacifica]|uniref:sigma-54-dependent transcriptional regulator n=1 Tax=Plesiocystis pacifica TaxID=191768 RepID=UPI0012F9E96F|nr:sigma 54-interacting transcriptional regulator [Plesiocystis pacifica]
MSIGGGAGPLLTAMTDSQSPFKGRVEHIYLCTHAVRANTREREALEQTREGLREHPVARAAKLKVCRWKAKASPIEHEPIRRFAERTLLDIRRQHPSAHIVIHLSPGTPAMHAIWLLLGSTGFIDGPLSLIQTADKRGREAGNRAVQLVELNVESWLQRYRTMRLSRADDIDDGQLFDPTRVRSEAMRDVIAKLERWATSPAPVLLLGERGSGKTSLAAWLRARSPFSNPDLDPWPVVVCGQFQANPQLAQSKLFGHVQGAFTGAAENREGLLDAVDGDSLFLDEIADIDRATQRSLMAAVEGRGFYRLGDTELRYSNFRLISATNRSLQRLRQDRILDDDFLDRVAVFVLRIPPLRECREDLPDSWMQVLARISSRVGASLTELEELGRNPKILALLERHRLPGNFRDLERAAHHLLVARAAGAKSSKLVDTVREGLDTRMIATDAVGHIGAGELRGELPLDEGDYTRRVNAYKLRWLRAALAHAGGNKANAAKALGMKESTYKAQLTKLSETE